MVNLFKGIKQNFLFFVIAGMVVLLALTFLQTRNSSSISLEEVEPSSQRVAKLAIPHTIQENEGASEAEDLHLIQKSDETTLLYNSTGTYLDAIYFNKRCELPCWQNLILGKDTKEEVYTQLQSFTPQVNRELTCHNLLGQPAPQEVCQHENADLKYTINFYFIHDTLHHIEFTNFYTSDIDYLNQILDDFLVNAIEVDISKEDVLTSELMFEHFGEPKQYFFQVMHHTHGFEGRLVMLFPSGILTESYMHLTSCDILLQIRPNQVPITTVSITSLETLQGISKEAWQPPRHIRYGEHFEQGIKTWSENWTTTLEATSTSASLY